MKSYAEVSINEETAFFGQDYGGTQYLKHLQVCTPKSSAKMHFYFAPFA